MRILQRSSLAIFDCLISETAVTSVSIALAKSPENNVTSTITHLCNIVIFTVVL